MPLGKAVFQSLTRNYDRLPKDSRRLLRELFTTADPSGVGVGFLDALPAVQRWLDATALQNRVLSQPGHQLATVFAPMLVWAFNQPWAGDIRLSTALTKWQRLATEGQSTRAHHVHAGVFSRILVESLPFFNNPPLPHFYTDVYDALDSVVGPAAQCSARTDAKEAAAITDVTIALGHLAWAAPKERGQSGVELQTRWSDRWTPLWDNMTYSQNVASVYAMLDSNLPDDQKWCAMSYTSPNYWQQEFVAERMKKLRWPKDEYEFSRVLPWVDCPRTAGGGGLEMHEHAIKQNKDLLQKYCPSFVDNIMLLASEDDWANSAQMRAWVELAKPQAPADSLPLPVGYEDREMLP